MRQQITKVFFAQLFILTFALAAFAQTNPVQITGGRIFVSPTQNSARIETPNFTAVGNVDWGLTAFGGTCPVLTPGCQPGTTFLAPEGGFFFLGEDYLRRLGSSFTINGATYQDVYFDGASILERVSFSTPKSFAYNKKRLFTLKKPFNYSTRMVVCQVSVYSAPCPANQLLFDGNLQGHGTLTLTLQTRLYPSYGTGYQIKSYDYQFEQ